MKRILFALTLSLLVATPPAEAAVFDIPTDRELIERADLVVIATPVSSRHVQDSSGAVFTVTTMRVDANLSGESSLGTIEVKERGGLVGDRGYAMSGVPQFTLGEQTLLFLVDEGAHFRTWGMAVGHFEKITSSGKTYFARTNGGTHLCGFSVDGRHHREMVRSARFVDWIRETSLQGESAIDYATEISYESLIKAPVETQSAHRGAYLNKGFGVPLRWTDGTVGSLAFKANGTQPGVNGLSGSQAAAAAWNGSGSDVGISVSSSCSVCERQLTDNSEMAIILGGSPGDVPANEAFVAAAQWIFVNSPYTKDGESFYPIVHADIIVSSNLTGGQALFDAIVTHEMGHALGFRHSNEASPSSINAIMYSNPPAVGANLQTWDLDAVQTVYGTGPACRAVDVTSQSSDTTVGFQQSTTLSIGINSDATNVSFQWYQGPDTNFANASPISGATSSTYNTGSLSPGTYFFFGKAFNECSSDVSSAIIVTAQDCQPAVITTEPDDEEIQAGETATLRVIGSGSSPLSIQWYRGESGNTGSPVFGATRSVFTTPALNATAQYWARVTNLCGSANSRTATVTVVGGCELPVITTQPMSQSVEEGSTVVLMVEATSANDDLSYQWYKVTGDQPVPVGTSSPSYETEPITQATSYYVEVTDSCGTTVSDTAVITLLECQPPVIDSIIGGGQIRYGARANLLVNASGDEPFSYQWYEGVSGDTSSPITGASEAAYQTPALTETARYWVRVSNECASADSSTQTVVPVCLPPLRPEIAVSPAEILSGIRYKVSWEDQPGVADYQLEEATNPDFTDSQIYDVTGQRREFIKIVPSPTKFYYRVKAFASCDGSEGTFSDTTSITVLPPPLPESTEFDVSLPEDATEPLQLQVFVPGTGTDRPFTVETTIDWLMVSPSSGVLPADGMMFTVTADPTQMVVGSNTGSFSLVFGDAAKTASSNHGSTTSVTVSLVTPVSTSSKTEPSPTSLFIPAVAHAAGFNSQWQSDVRVTNIGPSSAQLSLNYVPAGAGGASQAKSTSVNFLPSAPTAFNDIVKNWYGVGSLGDSQIGSLEISGSPEGLAAVASSRTFNVSPSGTFGQFIPAIPFFKFAGASESSPSRLSIQQVSESAAFRTNVALLEASGKSASVNVAVYDAAGNKLGDIPVQMAPGELKTLNGLLAQNGFATDNGRLEITVTSGDGRVHGYASVVDNLSGDPFLIPAADVAEALDTEWSMAGIGDFQTGTANWRTDIRIYNAGDTTVSPTLTYHPQGGGAPATASTTIAPGEMKVLNNLLRETFGRENSSGILKISTSSPASLVATGRIYDLQAAGTYGQFVPAVTESQSFGVESRPMYVLQLEQSEKFRSNLGLAEISGQPVTMKITAIAPGLKVAPSAFWDLPGNGFVQLNSVLTSFLGTSTTHNAQILVEVVGGSGRITAYGSVVDNRTQDPTYVPGQ